MSADDDLIHDVRERIGRITFNRPEARNAMTFAMYQRLAEICAAAPSDGSLRAIIVTGAGGKAFAAGTDMTQFRAFEKTQDALDYERRMDQVLSAVERCAVPTIAAIDGACTGGGAAIAAACDIRLATASLKFGFPIARTLGNCLSAANLARLQALLGAGRLREILFTARLIGAEEALAVGLVSEILTDGDALETRAMALAEALAGHAPLTLRATKEAMRRLRVAAADVEDADLIEMCFMSRDFREGMEAFLAKRKPDFRGE